MNNLKISITAKLYNALIEWIIKHIVVVYALELLLITALFVYGVTHENGFRACGY
ncbi:hypothetical protein ACFL30_00940 [Candidatus Latescibacterota bacterium]